MIRAPVLAAALLAGSALAGSAASAQPAPGATGAGAAAVDAPQPSAGSRFSGDHAFRAFNCHGGDAVISGRSNHLKLRDCSRLTLSGEKNQIDITLSSPGDMTVSGSTNSVRYRAPADGPPRITDNGQGDDIRPVGG